jgi:hypothetical protein
VSSLKIDALCPTSVCGLARRQMLDRGFSVESEYFTSLVEHRVTFHSVLCEMGRVGGLEGFGWAPRVRVAIIPVNNEAWRIEVLSGWRCRSCGCGGIFLRWRVGQLAFRGWCGLRGGRGGFVVPG